MKVLKKIIIKVIPNKLKALLGNLAVNEFKKTLEYASLSYSQEGEDLILNRFLEPIKTGFYVDIGAHHPKRFSNTYHFYKKGWRGINIDAMPNSMHAFNLERPEDINLELGISNEKRELIYYMFNEPALNTFSKKEAESKNELRNYKIIENKKIQTYSLEEVLDRYLPQNTIINFMTIDVEGLDLEVIKSNDWQKYRPSIILIEDLKKQSINDMINESELYSLLKNEGYDLVAKTFNTLFFKNNKV